MCHVKEVWRGQDYQTMISSIIPAREHLVSGRYEPRVEHVLPVRCEARGCTSSRKRESNTCWRLACYERESARIKVA